MIRRKNKNEEKGKVFKFWSHYHKIVDLCYEGNEELLQRLENSEEEKERFYILANIPRKYFDFEFDKIKNQILTVEENQEQVEKVEKYLDSIETACKQGIGLYLSGPHGVAKTTIAVIILKKAIELSLRCFFWKSSDIIEFIKSGWKNESRRVFFDYIENTVDFLVIDDVARLFEADKSERLFIDKIFTKRDDLNLSTILTSNHVLDDNRDIFGEALFSNFKERLIEVNLIGDDFRKVIGKKLLEKLDGKLEG